MGTLPICPAFCLTLLLAVKKVKVKMALWGALQLLPWGLELLQNVNIAANLVYLRGEISVDSRHIEVR